MEEALALALIRQLRKRWMSFKGLLPSLASCYAVVKFAAGNLYTGSFAGLTGLNAKLDFGIPYACRPTTLSGYYKYNSGVVDG